jgi:hypothetical protein
MRNKTGYLEAHRGAHFSKVMIIYYFKILEASTSLKMALE